jgi:hypothetical protein
MDTSLAEEVRRLASAAGAGARSAGLLGPLTNVRARRQLSWQKT